MDNEYPKEEEFPEILEKRRLLEEALKVGVVQIYFDPRGGSVVVPEQFKEDAAMSLNLSYGFDPPDLLVNNCGVRATLTFAGLRSKIFVPWESIEYMWDPSTSTMWSDDNLFDSVEIAELSEDIEPEPPTKTFGPLRVIK